MGKCYYCDYCQRSFRDDIDSRSKHLRGFLHNQLKKEYYVANRDLKTLLLDERAKNKCRTFLNTGNCSYGLQCRHSHYSDLQLNEIEAQLLEAEQRKPGSMSVNDIDKWVASVQIQRDCQTGQSNKRKDRESERTTAIKRAPSNLPPSLNPPTLIEMKNTIFTDWG